MNFLSRLFGLTDKASLREKIEAGALLLDVREKDEYDTGHAEGSIHIPLSRFPRGIEKISKDRPVIAVCASGARSAQAVRWLKGNGYEAYNGGSWHSFV